MITLEVKNQRRCSMVIVRADKNPKYFKINYPAASGRGITQGVFPFSIAASGGEYNPNRIKTQTTPTKR